MYKASLTKLHEEMRHCRRCLEAGYPITPGAIFSGGPSTQVMVVGQAPGVREGKTRLQFSGPAGKRLFSWLTEAGFKEEFRAAQYITAITKCYPGKEEIGGHNTYFSLLGPSAKAFLAQHVCGRTFILDIHKENDLARTMRNETY